VLCSFPLFSLFCPFDGFVSFVTGSCCVFFHPRFYFLMFGGAMYSFRGSRLEVCTLLFLFWFGFIVGWIVYHRILRRFLWFSRMLELAC